MKSALVKFVVFLLFLASPLLGINQTVYAHCHALNDSTGDSGSSFGFTDIVSTELSNNGSSIGVKITTAGNIPNGFGTTGQMVFGVMFPASLLSQDQNDTGINFITVHWKEDGTGYEGSQFIYRESLQSNPWSANIAIDGNTASFSIPKELIGKGDLAYIVTVGLISQDSESSDSAPDNSFSDCYIVPQSSPATALQNENGTSQSPSPQIVIEAPKKEGNKFIERPNVNRLTQKDVGKSFILPSPTPISKPALPKKSKSAAVQSTPAALMESARPNGFMVGLVAIFLIGATVIGTYLALGSKLIGENCDRLRRQVAELKEKISRLKEKIKELEKAVREAQQRLERAQEKAKESADNLKRHLKGKRPSGDDYMDYEGKRHYMKDYGYQTGRDVYDKKTQELEEKKVKAEEEHSAAEKEAGEIELDLETNSFNLQQSEKTLEDLERELALCEKKLAEAGREEAKRSAGGQGSRTTPPEEISTSGPKFDDDMPRRACTPGEEEIAKRYQCEFLVLDEKGEITFKVDRALQETGKEAETAGWILKIISWLLALGSIGLTLVNFFFKRGQMYAVFKAPVSLLGMTLGPAGDTLITISKIPRKMRVTEATLPAKRVINVCKKVYVCKKGEWVPELRLEKSYTKPGEDITFDLYDLGETLVEDLAKFLKEEAKRQFADPEKISREPCSNCRVKIGLD